MNDRLKKFWSQLAGPQATALENGINGLWIVVATVAFVVSLFLRDIQWSWYQWLIAVFLLVDIAGGISVNASNSAKRWWHRRLRPRLIIWSLYRCISSIFWFRRSFLPNLRICRPLQPLFSLCCPAYAFCSYRNMCSGWWPLFCMRLPWCWFYMCLTVRLGWNGFCRFFI